MKSWCPVVSMFHRTFLIGAGIALAAGFAIAEPSSRESFLTVRVNGKDIADNEPVIEWEPGRLYISSSVFFKAKLPLPPVRPTHIAAFGDNYYPIDAIPGASYRLDSSLQAIDINVPFGDGSGTYVDALGNVRTAAMRPEPGVFLNHDFQFLQDRKSTRLNSSHT